MEKIFIIDNKKEEKFLRQKTVDFDFAKFKKSEIRNLIKTMREIMKHANGVGLSANQIGLPYRFFIAQVPDSQGKLKFYAIANPELTKIGKETVTLEEGCLSVPETYGPTERHYRVVLTGYDYNGKKIKIKAWGLLARVFQHEVDHLNGSLFIDTAKALHKVAETKQTDEHS